MNARFQPQRAERAMPVDLQTRALIAAETTVLLHIDGRDPPSLPTGQRRVHVDQVAGEDSALGSTDAHRDFNQRVEVVMRLGRQEPSTKMRANVREPRLSLGQIVRRDLAHLFVRIRGRHFSERNDELLRQMYLRDVLVRTSRIRTASS